MANDNNNDNDNFIESISDDPFEEALKTVQKGETADNNKKENTIEKATNSTENTPENSQTTPDNLDLTDDQGKNLEMLLDLEVDVYMEVGRSTMLVSDLLLLGQSSVIELDRLVGDDLELVIGNKKIGKLEVVIAQDKFAGRIKRILSYRERLHAINS